jgi:ribosomal protein L6P/L9E
MLWYGIRTSNYFKKVHKRANRKYNVRTRTLAFPIARRGSLSFIGVSIYIPKGWNALVLNSKTSTRMNKLLYIYSDIYYFKIPVSNYHLMWGYDVTASSVYFSNWYTTVAHRTYFTRIKEIFYSFSRLFFRKLKIKGKGYYIYKNYRNTITHQFGHSHRWYIHAFFITVKFLNKTTVFLFGSSKRDIFATGHNIRKSKFYNIFTGRGVRFSRQIIYKKTGKVSTYR